MNIREWFQAAGGLAVVEHVVSNEGGGFISGGAAVFLKPLFLIEAFGPETGKETGASFSGEAAASGDFVDLLDEPLVHGIVEGDAVMTEAHGIALIPDSASI